MTNRNQKLSASISIGSVLQGSVKKNVGVIKSGMAEIGASIRKVEARQEELAKQRRVLEREGKSVAALDREYDGLSRTLDDLKWKQERWNRAAAASRRVGQSFGDMMSNLRRNATTLAVGTTVAAGAVFGLASSTAQLGDDAAKTADKLGIGITQLQELRFAAERSGVATSQFDTALEKMQKNLGEASTGTGTAKDALEQLGLKAEDLIKLSPDEALGRIAEEMDKVETAAEKAAIANDLFGRSGVGMINMLRGGKKNLDALREAARRTGFVLSEKAARDAEVFQDTLLDTQLTMKGLKNTVGAALLPVITDAMGKIGDALVNNQAQVKIWADKFAGGVERAIPIIGEVVSGLASVVTTTGAVVSKVAEMVGGWENFGVVIGAALASKTILSIGKFGAAVFSLGRAFAGITAAGPLVVGAIRAIGLALVANPIGVVVAAIAAGALAITANWGTVKAALKPVLDWIGEAFQKLWRLVEPVIEGLKWVKEKGAAAADAVFGDGKGTRDRIGQLSGRSGPGSGPPIQQNALGGSFARGFSLTGEKGPELKFENRAGYIANNRALRQLAGYSDRVSSLMSGFGNSGTMGASQTAGSTTITNHFQINAAGMSPDALISEIERRARRASNKGLFDRAPATGPLGR